MLWTFFSLVLIDAPAWPWLTALAAVVLAMGFAWALRSALRSRPAAAAPGDDSLRTQLDAARRLLAEARSDLARSSESLRLAADLAEVGIWFWDTVADVQEWSDRCKIHLGLPPGRTPDMEFFYSVVHPEDRERVRALVDRSLADRTDYRTVYRIVHPDGTHHWLAAMGRAQYDAKGKPISMGGVTIDVTRLTQLQEELRASEALSQEQSNELEVARRHFQLLAENATDVVVQTDGQGVVRWITPSVKLRLGREPDKTVGTRFVHLVHPDDWNRVRVLEEETRRGSPADAELRLRIADDGYQWFSVSMRPLFDSQSAVVGHVAGCRDIHREVLSREAAVNERQRLRSMLSGLLDPLVVFQPVHDDGGHVVDFVYVYANAAACTVIGADGDHLLGTRLLEQWPEADSSGLLRSLVTLAESGEPLVLDDFPLPIRGVGLRRMDVRGMRVDDVVSCVWRDVTDRHTAAERLAVSEEQFRLLAENALDVVVLIDMNDRVRWVSPSMTPVLGWKAADCIGKSAVDFLATGESRERYLGVKGSVLAGQGAVARVQLRDAAGVVHWAEVHSSPFRTAEGRIDGMVSLTRIIDAEIQAEQSLEHLARTDDLTQLLNRHELLDRLDALLARSESSVAVLWCDIDRFKAINDTHGHAGGDAFLRALADRIRGCLRTPDDIGARIGGDEFMVVLGSVHDVDGACRVAEDLRRAAADPVTVEGGTIRATVSIGVTLSRPHEGIDALLARADDAMYQAKDCGRDRVVAAAALEAAVTAGNL